MCATTSMGLIARPVEVYKSYDTEILRPHPPGFLRGGISEGYGIQDARNIGHRSRQNCVCDTYSYP